MLHLPAFILLAYLLGSAPTGLVVSRLLGGPDPRRAGSGNVGAANVYRLLGPKAAAFTLAGDILKGAAPLGLALLWLPPQGAWQETALAAVGLAAVLGHMFPLYLGFRGGKGVATAFGVVAVLCPWAAFNLLLVYLITLSRTRIFSVAALLCAWLLPVAVGLFADAKAYIFLAGVLSGLILLKHRENLERLFKGEEPHI
jgi:acyl phosphate:glycerol-3-phosphate acyltransferase